MAPPGRRALPRALPEGFILTDGEKKRWRLGRKIGQGGCGLIYLASRDVDRPVTADTEFVIKVEYQENGPLFSELKFYQRAAKPDSMENWKRSRKLDFLGIPTYWGSGLAECNDLRYRFMAMDRLGCDLQKVCERNGGRLKKATVLQLGRGLLDVLEYIHENEYVHADIKAANLMLGCKDPEQVYLADYGLSYRYCPDGVHKEYKENPKKGHNGTIEYTSLDAHKGLAPSRRGDLQILGFCLLHWLCGSLPWDKVLKNPTQVQEAKDRLMKNLPDSVRQLSVSGASTDEVATFLRYVKTLDYKDKPNYQHLKHLLTNDVTGRLDLSKPKGPAEDSIPAVREPPAREKRAGRASRASQARASEVDDEEGAKSKPVAARYTRGPALPKQEDGVPPAVSRSMRHRPVVSYREDDGESEEEEEEEEDVEARPKPILACYLRGPPIGPRAHSKQKPHGATWSSRETRERQEQPLHSQRTNIQTSIKDRTHVDYRDRAGDPDGSDCGSPQQGLHRRHFLSPLSGPEQEAGPTQTHGLISWLLFVGVFLILVLLFV